MKEQKREKKVLFSGVLLLSLSTILVKIIGLLYKIPMLSFLGSEGMGYFQSAYEIYALFCVISTAGLPLALSVFISGAIAKGKEEEVPKIYQTGLWIFLFIGFLGSISMAVFANPFCKLIKSENTYFSLLAISPSVLMICAMSAIRGYFQGYQKMLPTALSQLIEAIGKLGFGLWFAKAALEKGMSVPLVAAFAGAGLSLGSFCAFLYLWMEKLKFSKKKKGTAKKKIPFLWKKMLLFSIPITLGASAVSLTRLADMTLILRRLQFIGYQTQMANSLYGAYTTLALSVYALVPTLLGSMSLPLVPMLSGAIATKNKEKQKEYVKSYLYYISWFAIPSSFAISAFSKEILSILFQNESEAVEIASPLLAILGSSVLLSCWITATNSILHSFGIVKRPIVSLMFGAIIKIVFAYFLIGNPNIGILGAPISTLFCNIGILVLNLIFLKQTGAFQLSLKEYLPVVFSAVIAVTLTILFKKQLIKSELKELLFYTAVLAFCGILYLLCYLFLFSVSSFGKEAPKKKILIFKNENQSLS